MIYGSDDSHWILLGEEVTFTEAISMVPNFQVCVCKQTQIPADIIYKFPDK
jgi:hypothetical protein